MVTLFIYGVIAIVIISALVMVGSIIAGFKNSNSADKEMNYVLKHYGITNYEHQQFEDNHILLHDIDGEQFWVISPTGYISRYYEDISDVELVIDDVVEYKTSLASSAGRAIAGGVLAGGIGAVVGGMTGSKSGSKAVQRIELILSYQNGKKVYSKITLLNSEKGESIFGDIYRDAYEDGLYWSKLIAARMS